MKRPQLISQGSLNRMMTGANAAWEQGNYQECFELLERASRLNPSNFHILLNLGRYHGLRYNYAAAERCFEQAMRIAPRKMEMHTAIADHCQNFRNPDIAERFLRRALEQPDVTPLVCVKQAEVYERLRRIPEATELVERALALNPAYPAALLVRARLERLAGQLEAAEKVLRSFISKPFPDIWTKAQAWYELGHLSDRQGKYDDAMAAFLEAKSLLQPRATRTFDLQKNLHSVFKAMTANISTGMFQRWFDDRSALVPPHRLALLGGYARSGTTLLEQVLDAHPDIVAAEETEVFIDDAFASLKRHLPPDAQMLPVLEAADAPALQQARAAYFHAMDLCVGNPIAGRLLLDKNPMFTCMIPAIVRIFPETRFLIALRDPRDVVLSRFMQILPPGPLNNAFSTFEGTAEDYSVVMGIWRTLKPLLPGRYLEVRYEDMVDDLPSVARQTLEFLGVPWDDRVLGFYEHARKKMVRTPTYADVTQPVYKRAMGRWRNYQKYLEPHLEKLEPFVKAFGYE